MTDEKKTLTRKRPNTVSKKELLAKDAVRELAEAKRIIAEQNELVKQHSATVLDFLDSTEQKVVTVTHGKETITATRVQAEKVEIDDENLRKKIGAGKFDKISKRVVDSGLLGEAIKSGSVSEVDVASVSTIKPGTPYVKVTRK